MATMHVVAEHHPTGLGWDRLHYRIPHRAQGLHWEGWSAREAMLNDALAMGYDTVQVYAPGDDLKPALQYVRARRNKDERPLYAGNWNIAKVEG